MALSYSETPGYNQRFFGGFLGMRGHTEPKPTWGGGVGTALAISGVATAVQGVGLCSGAEIQKIPPA